ncbi:MAG: hypothetical protein HW376_1816, partial [candidate division NC10 bacterium]|nr:hypothetical protein [candidate division NC10 bacterium]
MPYKRCLSIGTLLLLSLVAPAVAQESLTLSLEATANLSSLVTEALRSNPEILAAR